MPSRYVFEEESLQPKEPQTYELYDPTPAERAAFDAVMSELERKRKYRYWGAEKRRAIHAAHQELFGAPIGQRWRPLLAKEILQEIETRVELRLRAERPSELSTLALTSRGVVKRAVAGRREPDEWTKKDKGPRSPSEILAEVNRWSPDPIPSEIKPKMIAVALEGGASLGFGGRAKRGSVSPERWVDALCDKLGLDGSVPQPKKRRTSRKPHKKPKR